MAAVHGDKTIAQIAGENKVHPVQVSEWKKQLLEHGADVFTTAVNQQDKNNEKDHDEPIQTIGTQTVTIEWLKKN